MKKLLCIAALLAVSACASTPSASQADASAAIQAAQKSYQHAQSVDFAWRDTGKIIKKAKSLEGKGDYAAAVKLANKAKRQGELAYQQYLAQQGASGPRMN
ncbi:MAG: SoxXA-binding protein [Gammaproteobacteria bacterium]